jgi:tripartite-type tricarboxylate transporter receptor subunit TctC
MWEMWMTRLLSITLATLMLAGAAVAQTGDAGWPDRPIRLVVPFPAGSSTDIVARIIAQKLGQRLGQQIVVENRAGASGNIGVDAVAKAAPDGYTIGIATASTQAVAVSLGTNLPYDPIKDFAPVAMIGSQPYVLVLYPGLPAQDMAQLIALAKAKPGVLNYGSAGNGSAGHLAMEYLKMVTGINVQHVPYKGTGPMLQDLLGGRTEATSAGTPALLPHIHSGKLRAIAVGTQKRIPALPDVPTVAEMGYPEFETSQWYGVLVAAGTPREIVLRLNAEINKALQSSHVTQRYATDNAVAEIWTPEQFGAFIAKEQARWRDVVRRADIKIE